MDLVSARLVNQHLTGTKFSRPEEVVAWMGAVQSQDYTAGAWSISLRLKGVHLADIDKAYNEGKILRTHVMRPTWHFVLPEDIRWMLNLTSAKVKAGLASYYRKLELSEELIARCGAIFAKALEGGGYLTRQELAGRLEQNGIPAKGQRLGHIVAEIELDGLICSGPKRGKQFTYALLEERVPKAKKLSREGATAKLAFNYFRSHGPAQLKDFCWWSGLTLKEGEIAIELNRPGLRQESQEGKTYWFAKDTDFKIPASPTAFLLSIYDEYTIAYQDRSALSQSNDIERMIAMGNALTAVIILDGKVAGTWKKELKKKAVEISLSPFRQLTPTQQSALEEEVKRYGRFMGMEVGMKMVGRYESRVNIIQFDKRLSRGRWAEQAGGCKTRPYRLLETCAKLKTWDLQLAA